LKRKDAPVVKPEPDSTVFRRIRIEPAYKAVSAEIERSILSGALPPGAPLPTEQEMAERFGVNRSTVREAIRQIEQEGLVQRLAGRRLFVTLPGLTDFAPRAIRLLLLQQTTFHELWEVAIELERLAARLAARQRCDADIDELAANIAEAEALLKKDQAKPEVKQSLIDLDIAFHVAVARTSGNRALMLAREPVSLLYRSALAQLHDHLPQSQSRNLVAHRKILDALRLQDTDEAEQAMRKHMIDFQRGFVQAHLKMDVPITLPV
jgi:DNA-binding FadR family transcriptional regulator